MRIGILTQPLFCNYGGIAQCYALQTVLKRMGHDVIVIEREFNTKYTFLGACVYYIKHLIKLLIGKRSSWHYYVNSKRFDFIAQNTKKFIENNINPRSKHCYTTEELKQEVISLNLDAIIVGSDQVWRPDYSPCLPNYFLDFLGNDNRIKRISYAASFGCDEWTYSEKQTQLCGTLLKQFNAVSVRERSAVDLCKKHFGVNAIQTLDPTMLLDQKDYKIFTERKKEKRGDLFCYVLDKSLGKRNIITYISKTTRLKSFESMPELESSPYNLYGNIDKCIYPPIEDWLSAFIEADMVVTDSFHGTVFSIIYNKPFWVIGNEERGMARFESLLSLFSLQSRLITESTFKNIDLNAPINWEIINERKRSLQKESIQFIINALN